MKRTLNIATQCSVCIRWIVRQDCTYFCYAFGATLQKRDSWQAFQATACMRQMCVLAHSRAIQNTVVQQPVVELWPVSQKTVRQQPAVVLWCLSENTVGGDITWLWCDTNVKVMLLPHSSTKATFVASSQYKRWHCDFGIFRIAH